MISQTHKNLPISYASYGLLVIIIIYTAFFVAYSLQKHATFQTAGFNLGNWDQMMDEWHLYSFDLALLQEISKCILLIREIKAIPFSLIPLRYVACCQLTSLDSSAATAWHNSRSR